MLIIYESKFSPYYKHNLNLELKTCTCINIYSIYRERQLPRMGVFIVQFKLLVVRIKVADGSLKNKNKTVKQTNKQKKYNT